MLRQEVAGGCEIRGDVASEYVYLMLNGVAVWLNPARNGRGGAMDIQVRCHKRSYAENLAVLIANILES